MLECPACGAPEIFRQKIGDKLVVIFGCLLSVTLDANKSDIENQQILDEWKRTGKMEEWLKKPLDETDWIIITDKKLLETIKNQFEKLWEEGKKLERSNRKRNTSKL